MNQASEVIGEYLASLPGWQRDNLEIFRKLIHAASSQVSEDFKWSVPVFLANGKLVCAMSAFKEHTKYNFFEGAALNDVHNLFNSGLDSKKHRSINLREGEKINEGHLKSLIKEALEHAVN